MTTTLTLNAKFLMMGSGTTLTDWFTVASFTSIMSVFVSTFSRGTDLMLHRVTIGNSIMATVLAGLDIRIRSFLNIVVIRFVRTVAIRLVVVFVLDVILKFSVSGSVIMFMASFDSRLPA